MFLNDILTDVGLPPLSNNIEINGLTGDSRQISQGYLFAALPGSKTDGTAYLQEAADRGAVAAFVPEGCELPQTDMIYIPVPDTRLALSKAATTFYQPQPKTIVAVTGTNGKTSTANFVRQIWDYLGDKAAAIGTLGIITAGSTTYGSLTTPDSVTLNQELKGLADRNYTHVAVEASSHGLEQHRIDGITLTTAAFTNITRDHLDYHKTMENYLAAKMRLFDLPLLSKTVVLNADIVEYEQIAAYCRGKGLQIIDYGTHATTLCLKNSKKEVSGQELELEILGCPLTVHLPLAGTFQAMNALCALGLAIASGADAVKATEALEHLKGAPGRMEFVGKRKNGSAVYVDYAHTPDALETILKALRPHTTGRLSVVFGCGGDRDPGKRPQMGEIANRLADDVYVTDDNPRSEEPSTIREAILEACPKAVNVGSRALAIGEAIAQLKTGDILVIAGKGHETGQLIKGIVHPFDDRLAAKKAIEISDTPLWTSKEIAGSANGKTESDFEVFGISIDSRTIENGDLYIAIKGENLDGHDFAADAITKGAAGVLVSTLPSGVPAEKAIIVADTQKALEAMARYARRRGKARIIGVTGSSGKTSTKEMLRATLASVGITHTTVGNLNNNIGTPLTLARMPKNADYAVIEMGINHIGEMTELTRLVEPDIAVITMVGSAHCEFFKTQEETAHAKAEIFKGMKKDGLVFLNADNRHFDLLKGEAERHGLKNIFSFGTKSDCNISLTKSTEMEKYTSVTAKIGKESYSYKIQLLGLHQVMNSLAVVGVLKQLHVDIKTALQSLGQLTPPKGRGQRFTISYNGASFTLIDDAYNANPESMRAGIAVLGASKPKNKGRRIAVIGDMLELGETAEDLHKSLAKDLIENKIDLVYTVGKNMGALFDTLPQNIQGEKRLVSAELAEIILPLINKDDIVLVKGSNGSRMVTIVETLKNAK